VTWLDQYTNDKAAPLCSNTRGKQGMYRKPYMPSCWTGTQNMHDGGLGLCKEFGHAVMSKHNNTPAASQSKRTAVCNAARM
jgi:hypothetical protein